MRGCDEDRLLALARELSLNPLTTRCLVSRGLTDAGAVEAFFSPNLSNLPDPEELTDVKKASVRIAQAIRKKEKIAVFGDYDVDGITGAALLASFFREISIDVGIHLPNRDDGYGIKRKHIDQMKEEGAKLLITVDNGIRAVDEISYAKELGIETIITDHHEPSGSFPDALAIINPHRLGAGHPLWNLCGCGVAFMLLLSLRRHLREEGLMAGEEPNLKRHLDLVALGTIADVMNLTGVNRTLVKFGLAELSKSSKPGINALIKLSGAGDYEITPGTISFQIAPRINAAGRMGAPSEALRLLMTNNADDAYQFAARLDKTNRERQSIEEKILRSIDELVDKSGLEQRSGIVLSSPDWHLGVIGIIASKLAERYAKPAIVITKGTNPARGSARSVEGISLLDALKDCSSVLEAYGGHSMAAGVAIECEKIDEFTMLFDAACAKRMPAAETKKIFYDAEAKISDITDALVSEIDLCKPFGMGNPEPSIAIRNAVISERKIVGNGHLKLTLSDGNASLDAIAFGMASKVPDDAERISVLCTPKWNIWNGFKNIQLKIKEIEVCSK